MSLLSILVFLATGCPILTLAKKAGVKKVAIKTGTTARAGSEAVATLKICDGLDNCCQTEDLDNPGDDRVSGQTDVYESSLLSTCRQARFDPTTNWSAELELKKDIYGLTDGWFVEWLQITTEQQLQFQCNFNIKLKRGLLGSATSKNTTCALAGSMHTRVNETEAPEQESSPNLIYFVGASVLAVVIIACVIGFVISRRKRTTRVSSDMYRESLKVEMNPVYGVYYSSGGSQVDQGEAEIQDTNDNYYQS